MFFVSVLNSRDFPAASVMYADPYVNVKREDNLL